MTESKIRRVRHTTGETQEMLAQAVGVSALTINRIEEGRTVPDLDLLERIALALGVDVASLGAPPTVWERLDAEW